MNLLDKKLSKSDKRINKSTSEKQKDCNLSKCTHETFALFSTW